MSESDGKAPIAMPRHEFTCAEVRRLWQNGTALKSSQNSDRPDARVSPLRCGQRHPDRFNERRDSSLFDVSSARFGES
jgi:hypothetical protein